MLQNFISLLFPKYCLACNHYLINGENHLCTHCRHELPQTDYHTYPDNELYAKFGGRLPLKHALAYLKFTKEGRVQKILHALKYKGCQSIGELLGIWYGHILRQAQFENSFDLIIPIPLHPSKQKKRGYNQSDCFARGLSKALQIPWDAEGLTRIQANQSQTTLGKLARWDNVAHIFNVSNHETILNRRILLVDDVVTTGSTLEAGLNVLHQAGAREISVAVIAIAE